MEQVQTRLSNYFQIRSRSRLSRQITILAPQAFVAPLSSSRSGLAKSVPEIRIFRGSVSCTRPPRGQGKRLPHDLAGVVFLQHEAVELAGARFDARVAQAA